MSARVCLDNLITLHYRLATADDAELVSTFGSTPATLQLGNGELAPSLERCIEGLPVGERHVFLLEADQAFGAHNPALLQRIARSELPAEGVVEAQSLVEFTAPDGNRFAGVVSEIDDDSALIDFNHPLAGKAVRFEVEVVGIL